MLFQLYLDAMHILISKMRSLCKLNFNLQGVEFLYVQLLIYNDYKYMYHVYTHSS